MSNEFRPYRAIIGEETAGVYVSAWFDPGGTTGWSLFAVVMEAMRSREYKIMDNVVWWTAGQFKGPEVSQAEEMLGLVKAWPGCKVGVEDFHLRQLAVDLAPVRITGMFEFGLNRDMPGKSYIKQQPSLAKTTISDQMLKDLGLWPPLSGMEHARDAVKHNLTWLRRHKEILAIDASTPPPKKAKA